MIPEHDYLKILKSMPVVCVDAAVVNEKGEYLLVKRENEPLKGEFWVPGGRVIKNEKLDVAIRRKMAQELGINVKVEKLLGFFEETFDKTAQDIQGGFHAISFVFLVRPEHDGIKLDAQSSEWGWFKELPVRLRKILKNCGELNA